MWERGIEARKQEIIKDLEACDLVEVDVCSTRISPAARW
jgi:hypothetical protein